MILFSHTDHIHTNDMEVRNVMLTVWAWSILITIGFTTLVSGRYATNPVPVNPKRIPTPDGKGGFQSFKVETNF